MPKISDKKVTLYDLDKMSVEERTEALKPIVEANRDQLTSLGTALAEMANSSLFDALKSFSFPYENIVEKLKMPEFPVISLPQPDVSHIDFTRYDPPVTIKKSEWEIEKEKREAYMTELQIQILEQQLNIVKGMQTPQYDISTGIITFMGKKIEIPLNTNLEMVCRVVLKNIANMKRKWSWDEIVEQNRESVERFTPRSIYTATRAVNDKVALETSVKDFLLAKPTTTIQLNPLFVAK